MKATLSQDAIAETYNDMQGLISKAAWKFYEKYGGDFEEWRAEANLTFIQTYNSHRKNKAQLSTWLYFCIWKSLLSYSRILYKQNQVIATEDNIIENLEDNKKRSFSSLELFDGIGDDTKTLIYLIWNLPHDLPISNGNNPCHMKVALRNYLLSAGWTWKRIRESFEEITEIIND